MKMGIPKGKNIKIFLDKILEWQMENPIGSKTDCQNYIENILKKIIQ